MTRHEDHDSRKPVDAASELSSEVVEPLKAFGVAFAVHFGFGGRVGWVRGFGGG